MQDLLDSCNTYTLISFLISSFLRQSKLKAEDQEEDKKGWRENGKDRK